MRKISATEAEPILAPVHGTATNAWAGHARRTLERAGYRESAPRTLVVDALAELGCSVTARDIAERVEARGRRVGLASVYRALELLAELGLVQRFDVGEGVARFEPALPSGEHHHHLVCDACGKVEPFSDAPLERALDRLGGIRGYELGAHDVVLRGACGDCQTAA